MHRYKWYMVGVDDDVSLCLTCWLHCFAGDGATDGDAAAAAKKKKKKKVVKRAKTKRKKKVAAVADEENQEI